MKPGSVVPALVAVAGRNVIDGMKVWGRADGETLSLFPVPYLTRSMAQPSRTAGVFRVDVTRDGPGGAPFLLVGAGALVLVERGPS